MGELAIVEHSQRPLRSTTLVSVPDDLVLFRATMEEPIAIGVRGVVLDVDPETGEVLQASLTHSAPLPFIEQELGEDS